MDIPMTDPIPYIYSSYVFGILLVLSYTVWMFYDERKLKQLQSALNENPKGDK
jgi:hypothetical protein